MFIFLFTFGWFNPIPPHPAPFPPFPPFPFFLSICLSVSPSWCIRVLYDDDKLRRSISSCSNTHHNQILLIVFVDVDVVDIVQQNLFLSRKPKEKKNRAKDTRRKDQQSFPPHTSAIQYDCTHRHSLTHVLFFSFLYALLNTVNVGYVCALDLFFSLAN